jgi:hypothetical protein
MISDQDTAGRRARPVIPPARDLAYVPGVPAASVLRHRHGPGLLRARTTREAA